MGWDRDHKVDVVVVLELRLDRASLYLPGMELDRSVTRGARAECDAGRGRVRNFPTLVARGEKSTLLRAGSDSVLTGQRHTPQVACALCWATVGM
jgi:hypothetical protein